MRLSYRLSSIFLPFALAFALAPAAHAAGGDLYFGYSRLGSNAFYPNVGGLNGWEADGHLKLMPFVGLEADVSHYGLGAPSSTPRTTAVLFGPRFTAGAAGIHVFGRAMVGGEHSANNGGPPPISGGAFAVDFGGGADFRIAPFFAWRVNIDYLNAPTKTPDGANHTRFGTGLVFRF